MHLLCERYKHKQFLRVTSLSDAVVDKEMIITKTSQSEQIYKLSRKTWDCCNLVFFFIDSRFKNPVTTFDSNYFHGVIRMLPFDFSCLWTSFFVVYLWCALIHFTTSHLFYLNTEVLIKNRGYPEVAPGPLIEKKTNWENKT